MVVLTVAAILTASVLFAGCLSEGTTVPIKDTVFEVKPLELTVKSGDSGKIMVRVTNNGKSTFHPVIRFNTNPADKPYIKFSNESGSYDMGDLRPGEDSGFKIVDFRATLAAGREIKYQVRAQLIYGGAVLENKDIVITVTR